MKIVLVNDDYVATGGTNSVAAIVENLARQYTAMGHSVTVITSHRRESSPEIIRLPGVISLPVSYRISLRHYHCLYSPSVSWMLTQELRALAPDIVHAHNIHAYLTYDVLRIGKKLGAKVFITLHDVLSFSYKRVVSAAYLGPKRDARMTLSEHWRAAKLQYNPVRNWWIHHIFQTYVDQVFAVSKALQTALAQNGIPNVFVVHNGVDLAQWQKPEASALEAFKKKHNLEGRRVILFGGRLSVDKGSTQVLQAMKSLHQEFPDALLLVAGEKTMWSVIQTFAGIADSELDTFCRAAGWLGPDDMRLAYYASEIVTTPSVCLDCFPSTNLEAMVCRKPVVGTIFGGTPEAVQHEVTGFVCDPRSLEYPQYLARLLREGDLRTRMGDAGHARAMDAFLVAHQAEAYIRYYEQQK